MLKVIKYSINSYTSAWEEQLTLQKNLIDNKDGATSTLILCSHNPVITIGRSGSESNLLVSKEHLENLGIELHHIERGGDITYHGPEQMIAYPIIDLNKKKKDVHWYMRSLELVIIETLENFGVKGIVIPGKTGVWVNSNNTEKKISSIGVRISRWCTLHGISINVLNCQKNFALIHPCGLIGAQVTSIEEETGDKIPLANIQNVFLDNFCKMFDYRVNAYA